MDRKELWAEVVSLGSRDRISEMSTIIKLPLGSKLPLILRGRACTVIIVDQRDIKGPPEAARQESRAPVALALADLIGLLALKVSTDD